MSDQDGVDHRQHVDVLPQCIEMFRRVEEKVDLLITRADKINGRYEHHLEESIIRVAQIERHDEAIKNLVSLKEWGKGFVATIIIGSISSLIGYGMLLNQVRVNTDRITRIESSAQSKKHVTTQGSSVKEITGGYYGLRWCSLG